MFIKTIKLEEIQRNELVLAALCLHVLEQSHKVLPIVLSSSVTCAVLLCVFVGVSAHVLHYVALSPSCRLLENSAILDQYERASLTYEKAERRFTPA